MSSFGRTLLWLSSLKVAIALFLVIAIACSIGTAIPQGEIPEFYIEQYSENPWLGLFKGEILLSLQLNQIYSSYWFLALLLWLGFALIICSWRRQWPMLQSALRWVDYRSPRQIKKLILSKNIEVKDNVNVLQDFSKHLEKNGWEVNKKTDRLAARKGVIGRVGPLLVHLGLILLMIGSILGALNGQRIEFFLSPGKSQNLINSSRDNQLTLKLNEFKIDRDPLGTPEQFTSSIEINEKNQIPIFKEASVNHPIRFRGITIYQADWSLAAIKIKIGNSPQIQLPLTNFTELGDQIWGVVIPTDKQGNNPVLISLSSEKGPIQVFKEDGSLITSLLPGGQPKEVLGIRMQILEIIPSSGILIKRDPGVPIVYSGFAITLIGGILSVISTRQLWAIFEEDNQYLYIGGLSNRNFSGFANEFPKLLNSFSKS